MLFRTIRALGSKLVFTNLCSVQDTVRPLQFKCAVQPCRPLHRYASAGRKTADAAPDQTSDSSQAATLDQSATFNSSDFSDFLPPELPSHFPRVASADQSTPLTFNNSTDIIPELSGPAEFDDFLEEQPSTSLESINAGSAEDEFTKERWPRDYRGKSYSYLKRNRPSPYITLFNAIAEASPQVARLYRPPVSSIDLSYQNPDIHALGEKSLRAPADTHSSRMLILDQLPTLWSITAKVIANRQSEWNNPSSRSHHARQKHIEVVLPNPIFEEELRTTSIRLNAWEHALLKKTNFTLDSVEEWASIILEPDIDKAVARLHQLMFSSSPESEPNKAHHVPLFVIMLLLKRHAISSHSLQQLLHCTWHLLRFAPIQTEERQLFTLFVRLVRHATKVLPSSLPNIAAILTTFTLKKNVGSDSLATGHRTQQTLLYNSALAVLAYASGENPFRAWSFQARAQFILVSYMVHSDPPLDISSHGFAALVKAQLKHPKTPPEDEWTQLQSRAWPPYPQPRTAMDEDKGFEFAASRAMKTLKYMRQAGYTFPHWEQVASIYAGWDGGTPTIQTRHPHLPTRLEASQGSWLPQVMAARIRTTRDIRESWAQFLRYEDAHLPFSSTVYGQMFERICQENKRLEARPDAQKHPTSPGDMKEVIAPATSPMQKVFLPSDPPSFMDFFWRMMRREPTISPDLLGRLMAISPSISDGIQIWEMSRGDSGAKTLISSMIDKASSDPRVLSEWRTFSGFISLLCRFPWDESVSTLFHKWDRDRIPLFLRMTLQKREDKWLLQCSSKAVFQALYLVRLTRPHIQAVYTMLLKGLINAQYEVKMPERPPTFWIFPAVLEILSLMKENAITPEATFFDHLCHIMELGAHSSRKVLNMTREQNMSLRMQSLFDDAQTFMAVGSTVLRRAFAALYKGALDASQLQAATQGLEDVPPIPHALGAPTPVVVQRYIRALVVFQDYEGIYSLALWCGGHTEALRETMSQLPRGTQQWRHVLAAFRIALETPHVFFSNLPAAQHARADPELVQLTKTALEEMKDIGGWASDSEVEDFRMHVQLYAAMKNHERVMQNAG